MRYNLNDYSITYINKFVFKIRKKLINLHIASQVLKGLFMTLVKDCKAHLFKTITISTVIRAIKQRDWKQFVCRNKNGEYITKEHSGS